MIPVYRVTATLSHDGNQCRYGVNAAEHPAFAQT